MLIYRSIEYIKASRQLWLSSQSVLISSMRLRSKRTCSGVECFGAFHLKRFFFSILSPRVFFFLFSGLRFYNRLLQFLLIGALEV